MKMKSNKDYIYLNKHVLKYLNNISIDFLFINSKFTNTQDNVVYIKDVDNKEGTRFQIKCPSSVYSYNKPDIINRLLDGKYYDFCIPNTQNNINKILNKLFDHYHQKTIYNISFSNLEDFYKHTFIPEFFLKIGKNKVKELFNNYFDKVLNNQKIYNFKDLVDGEVYRSIMPSNPEWESLHLKVPNKVFKYRLYVSDKFTCPKSKFNKDIWGVTKDNKYKLATLEEKKWLNVCIKQNKFIFKSDLNLYDDKTFDLKSENNKFNFKVGDWVVRTKTGNNKSPIYKKDTLLQIKSIKGTNFTVEQDNALTIHYLSSVRKANEYEICSDSKPIKKWSVGSYILFLEDLDNINGKKGNIDLIQENNDNNYLNLEKYMSLNHTFREENNQIKWFATKKEAAEFSKSLEFEENKISDINISNTLSSKNYTNNPCAEVEYPATPDECVKKASKLNRKLLLL